MPCSRVVARISISIATRLRRVDFQTVLGQYDVDRRLAQHIQRVISRL